jgi:predicted dienelactone hydrolase
MKSVVLILLLVCFAPFAIGEESATAPETLLMDPVDGTRNRTVPVKVYLPISKTPSPVVLFSHGLGGSRNNNSYLGNHWAQHGYVGVFIQHQGSDEEVWKSAPPLERMAAMKKAANFQSAMNRFADVPFVIDQLEKWNADENHVLHGKLDLEHIGMSGHSFGAGTTQAMMGQKFLGDRSVADSRIDAFIAFSPSIHKRLSPEESFGEIQSPVLLMTGTKDGSPIDPSTTPESRMKVYAGLPAGDKYHLVFQDGEHHAFGDSGRAGRKRMAHHHAAIQLLSTKFWDAYLKGDSEAKAWLQSEEARKDSRLVAEDVWEWK